MADGIYLEGKFLLTDAALKALRPKEKSYKVTDRDGMYVVVSPAGTLSFRLDYRLHGRRETVVLGKYGPTGLSLARAREKCIDAKRAVGEGRSPAIEKQREKRRLLEARSFGELGEKWLVAALMADSTRAMRRSIFERELLPVWRKLGQTGKTALLLGAGGRLGSAIAASLAREGAHVAAADLNIGAAGAYRKKGPGSGSRRAGPRLGPSRPRRY